MNEESIKLWLFSLPKQSRVALLFSALAFSFSLFLLMPLDLYLNNIFSFNIGLAHVGLPLFIFALVLFAAIVFFVPFIFGGKYVDVFTMLLCGITLACYVQILFLNGDMELLTGETGRYTDIIKNALNILVWLFIILLPLNIWAYSRDHERFKKIKWEAGIITISVIILGMQASGVFAAVLKYEPIEVEKPYRLSIDKTFELSMNENICVFIMDMLEVRRMDEMLAKYPALIEQLDGFTYYRDHITEYPQTFPSVAKMFSFSYLNPGDTAADYWRKAWGEYNLVDMLRDNGYITTLTLSQTNTFGDINYLKDRVQNIVTANIISSKHNYNEIIKKTLMISFGRLSPYIVKDYFVGEILENFSSTFVEISFDDYELADTYMPTSVSNTSDIRFFNRLKTVGLSTPYAEDVFTFIHFCATHDGGYRYNEQTDSLYLNEDASRIDSGHGSFVILNEYFNQMKELGIYDDATIIIMADHSSNVFARERSRGINRERTSALLIKPKNAQGKLQINSTDQLSHINYQPYIMEIAGIPHKDYGYSYNDIINGGMQQETRVLYITGWSRTRRIPYHGHYVITGEAFNLDNWELFPYDGNINGDNNE